MFLLVRERHTMKHPSGVFSSFKKAKAAAMRLEKKAGSAQTSYLVYAYNINKVDDGIFVGSAEYRLEEGTVVWYEHNDPPSPKDPLTQFAYDLLNKDPIALDVLQDVLTKGGK